MTVPSHSSCAQLCHGGGVVPLVVPADCCKMFTWAILGTCGSALVAETVRSAWGLGLVLLTFVVAIRSPDGAGCFNHTLLTLRGTSVVNRSALGLDTLLLVLMHGRGKCGNVLLTCEHCCIMGTVSRLA